MNNLITLLILFSSTSFAVSVKDLGLNLNQKPKPKYELVEVSEQKSSAETMLKSPDKQMVGRCGIQKVYSQAEYDGCLSNQARLSSQSFISYDVSQASGTLPAVPGVSSINTVNQR